MKDRPFVKALLAEGYIVAFGLCVGYLFPYLANLNIDPGPAFGVAAILSMFVFSAACMGYFFLSSPLLLALEGKVKEAILYFAQTVLYFALLSTVSVALFFILKI